MKNNRTNPLINILKLTTFFKRNLKIRFLFLSILIIFSSITELLSISALIPFLFALTNPDKIISLKSK